MLHALPPNPPSLSNRTNYHPGGEAPFPPPSTQASADRRQTKHFTIAPLLPRVVRRTLLTTTASRLQHAINTSYRARALRGLLPLPPPRGSWQCLLGGLRNRHSILKTTNGKRSKPQINLINQPQPASLITPSRRCIPEGNNNISGEWTLGHGNGCFNSLQTDTNKHHDDSTTRQQR